MSRAVVHASAKSWGEARKEDTTPLGLEKDSTLLGLEKDSTLLSQHTQT